MKCVARIKIRKTYATAELFSEIRCATLDLANAAEIRYTLYTLEERRKQQTPRRLRWNGGQSDQRQKDPTITANSRNRMAKFAIGKFSQVVAQLQVFVPHPYRRSLETAQAAE